VSGPGGVVWIMYQQRRTNASRPNGSPMAERGAPGVNRIDPCIMTCWPSWCMAIPSVRNNIGHGAPSPGLARDRPLGLDQLDLDTTHEERAPGEGASRHGSAGAALGPRGSTPPCAPGGAWLRTSPTSCA